jgi:hypothetical protein
MSWLFFSVAALASANVFAQQPQNPPPGQTPAQVQARRQRERSPRQFLLSYFVDNGQSGVYLATSDDGFHFKPLLEPNVPIMVSELGGDRLCRDPFLMQGPDRQWHMLWTTGWWDRTVGLAHSKDLVHWTQQYVPAMVDLPGALNAWAPEMVYDAVGKKYVIFWSSTQKGRFASTAREDGDLGPEGEPLNHRFFATTTVDFKSFTPSRLLWDPKFNCIDLTIHLTREGDWIVFGKDETRAPQPAKFLFAASAPSPYGPFHMVSRRITGDYWAEGPTVVRIDGKTRTFRVYFDRYTEGRWGAVESSDMINWTDVSDKIEMVPGARHGSMMRVDKRMVDRLRERLRNKH